MEKLKLTGKTVNSIKKYQSTVNSNTVNSTSNETETPTLEEKVEEFMHLNDATPEGIGELVSSGLGDVKSLGYWTIIARNDPAKLLEAYHLTKDANNVRYPPAYCLSILRAMGVQTKFKRGGE